MHALDGQIAHDESLVHEGEGNAPRKGLSPEEPGGVELRILGQVDKRQPVGFREEAPPFAKSPKGNDPGKNSDPPGEVEHDPLEQIGKDDRGLSPEGDVGPKEQGDDRGRVQERDSKHTLNGNPDSEEVVPDVEKHVRHDDAHGNVPGGPVEAALKVLRDGADPGEIDDR